MTLAFIISMCLSAAANVCAAAIVKLDIASTTIAASEETLSISLMAAVLSICFIFAIRELL